MALKIIVALIGSTWGLKPSYHDCDVPPGSLLRWCNT